MVALIRPVLLCWFEHIERTPDWRMVLGVEQISPGNWIEHTELFISVFSQAHENVKGIKCFGSVIFSGNLHCSIERELVEVPLLHGHHCTAHFWDMTAAPGLGAGTAQEAVDQVLAGCHGLLLPWVWTHHHNPIIISNSAFWIKYWINIAFCICG